MQCVDCRREKAAGEQGWVTVLAPVPALRIHYCPECMADIVRRASCPDDTEDA
jgi:hypothetical protein